jgi:proline dehydrogenase
MSILAHSESALLNPDRNPVLRWFLKHTFYAQFCAGENAAEVKNTIEGLKKMGCKGVMLCYAKEAEHDDAESDEAVVQTESQRASIVENEILPWKKGTLATVALTGPGDFVALK